MSFRRLYRDKAPSKWSRGIFSGVALKAGARRASATQLPNEPPGPVSEAADKIDSLAA